MAIVGPEEVGGGLWFVVRCFGRDCDKIVSIWEVVVARPSLSSNERTTRS